MSEKRRAEKMSELSLVGRCFHIFKGEIIQYQGIVRGKISETVYLVQYFDWLVGQPSTLHLKTLPQMEHWQFYEDDEHMKFWHEYKYQEPPLADTDITEAPHIKDGDDHGRV